jgi:hypothetical protein
MNILMKVLFGFALLIIIALITAIFIKKEYSVERDITINKPKDSVYNYIKYLKNQNNYSKWASMDVNMNKEYKGTDGTVGFVYTWDSDKKDVGKGEQTIKAMVANESVDYSIHFIRPFEGMADAYLTVEPGLNDQTKVRWGFVGKMKYPSNLMLLFMNMDKMIGDDLAIGLKNLKVILDK